MEFDFEASLSLVGPELVLAGTGLFIALFGRRLRDSDHVGDIALGGLALSLVAMATLSHAVNGWVFGRMLIHDPFASFFKALIAVVAIVVTWMSIGTRPRPPAGYFALVLLATFAMFAASASGNLVSSFVAFELLGWTLYAAAGLAAGEGSIRRETRRYVRAGGVASLAMLAALGWIHVQAGASDLVGIGNALAENEVGGMGIPLAVLLLLGGLAVKILILPFRRAVREDGSRAIPILVLVSIGGCAVWFAVATRWIFPTLSVPFGDGQWGALGDFEWTRMLAVVAVVVMTLGHLGALRTRSLVRLLAYLAIGQAGFAAMSLSVGTDTGVVAAMFSLLTGMFAMMGAWAVTVGLRDMLGGLDLRAIRGVAARGAYLPVMAISIALFSLAGLPPFVGFFAKLHVFAAVLAQERYALAVVGGINMVLVMGLGTRVLAALLFAPLAKEGPAIQLAAHDRVLVFVLVALTCALGAIAEPLYAFARHSMEFLGT